MAELSAEYKMACESFGDPAERWNKAMLLQSADIIVDALAVVLDGMDNKTTTILNTEFLRSQVDQYRRLVNAERSKA